MKGVSIQVDSLTKRFGRVEAVGDVTFTAQPGRVTGFLGPNGAGKSTTLRMLLGLTRPDRGTALFAGIAYGDLPSPTRTVGAVLDIASRILLPPPAITSVPSAPSAVTRRIESTR